MPTLTSGTPKQPKVASSEFCRNPLHTRGWILKTETSSEMDQKSYSSLNWSSLIRQQSQKSQPYSYPIKLNPNKHHYRIWDRVLIQKSQSISVPTSNWTQNFHSYFTKFIHVLIPWSVKRMIPPVRLNLKHMLMLISSSKQRLSLAWIVIPTMWQ